MRVLVFDVIETLLDLQALDPAFEEVFGDKAVSQQWFQQMLQSAFVRPGMVLDPAGEQADIVAADLPELADQIIARERP